MRRTCSTTVILLLGLLTTWNVAAAEPPAEEAPPEPVLPPEQPVAAEDLGVPTPITDPNGRALSHFYESLKATQRGEQTTRVAVYGASHVAGDWFTRVIRHRLQRVFGDAGPGFIVPSRPWKDHNQRDANIRYSRRGWDYWWVSSRHNRDDGLYGLAGCTFASAADDAWCEVSTAEVSPYGRSVDRVEVFYWEQPDGGDFYVTIDGERRERIDTEADEAGPGYARFDLEDGPHEVRIQPRGDGLVTLFGVAMDRDRPGVVVDSMGINGARASAQLHWDPRLFADHLTRRDPDLVVLAYGTNATGDDNDPIEDYEKRLELVVNRVRSLAPAASCLVVGPSDRPIEVEVEAEGSDEPQPAFLPRPRQAQVIAAQERVAHRYGCGYWDWAAAMGGDLSMVKWVHSEPRHGARDYVHHTRRGYERMADLFWDALMASYRDVTGSTAVLEAASPKR
ncbi:MAG: GDSL-type esterase/lipase family protein [Myxococcota bacterium]